jgi:hypothetical protein
VGDGGRRVDGVPARGARGAPAHAALRFCSGRSSHPSFSNSLLHQIPARLIPTLCSLAGPLAKFTAGIYSHRQVTCSPARPEIAAVGTFPAPASLRRLCSCYHFIRNSNTHSEASRTTSYTDDPLSAGPAVLSLSLDERTYPANGFVSIDISLPCNFPRFTCGVIYPVLKIYKYIVAFALF